MIRRFQSGKRMSHAVVSNVMVFLSGQVADNAADDLLVLRTRPSMDSGHRPRLLVNQVGIDFQ